VRVIATGTVEIDAGKLTVEPRSIDLGGPDSLSDATGAVVRRLVTLEHDIGGPALGPCAAERRHSGRSQPPNHSRYRRPNGSTALFVYCFFAMHRFPDLHTACCVSSAQ
jgi:hypothetical protein